MSAPFVNRLQLLAAYNAPKAAAQQLTRSLAVGSGADAPARAWVQAGAPRFQRHRIDGAPMGRCGLLEELGPTIVYLASDARPSRPWWRPWWMAAIRSGSGKEHTPCRSMQDEIW